MALCNFLFVPGHVSIDVKDGHAAGGAAGTHQYHSKSLDACTLPSSLRKREKSPSTCTSVVVTKLIHPNEPSIPTYCPSPSRKSNKAPTSSPISNADRCPRSKDNKRHCVEVDVGDEDASPCRSGENAPVNNQLARVPSTEQDAQHNNGPSSSASSTTSSVTSPPVEPRAGCHQAATKSVRWLDVSDNAANNAKQQEGETLTLNQTGEMMTGGKRKSSGSRIKAWIDKKLSCESDGGGGSTSSSFDEGLFSPPSTGPNSFQVQKIVKYSFKRQ